MGVSELAQNEALRSLNSMMHNNLFPRMNVPRGSDDVMSGIANGYNMMGTIMEGIRARNDRNRLQELLKQQFGNGENGQPTTEQNRNDYTVAIGDTDKLNSFGSVLGNNALAEQKPEYTYSLGDTDKLNSQPNYFQSILGNNATQQNNNSIPQQMPQQDYSMQTFMRNAINKGMLPSNAMQAYSAYFAPVEQDIRDRNVRDAMRTLAFRNHGLSKEDEINALATINYNLGKNYAWEDESNRFDRDLKYDKNVLQQNGLWNPEMYHEYSDKYRIADDAYAGLGSVGVGSYGNTNVSAGSNAGFSQTDGNWSDIPYAGGTIGTSGCAPTTMANFLQRFGKNVTPAEIAKYSSENGFAKGEGGTSWGMFSAVGDKVGVPVQQTGSWADVMNALKSGQPVMAGHDPGKFTQNSYGGSGHWLMYNGLTPDGKIIVVDPNNGKKSGEYSAEEVRGDWERNNPVAFVAKDNKALPMQQQERQSFGNYLAQPVNRGGGARMSPMAMRKLATEEAERQRLQSNADRNFLLNMRQFEETQRHNRAMEDVRSGKGTGKTRNIVKTEDGSEIALPKLKDMTNDKILETIKNYSDKDLEELIEDKSQVYKVGDAFAKQFQSYYTRFNGDEKSAIEQMVYDLHGDSKKPYTLDPDQLGLAIGAAYVSGLGYKDDPARNINTNVIIRNIHNYVVNYLKENENKWDKENGNNGEQGTTSNETTTNPNSVESKFEKHKAQVTPMTLGNVREKQNKIEQQYTELAKKYDPENYKKMKDNTKFAPLARFNNR